MLGFAVVFICLSQEHARMLIPSYSALWSGTEDKISPQLFQENVIHLSFLPTWVMPCSFTHREDSSSSNTTIHRIQVSISSEHIPATSSTAEHHTGCLKASRKTSLGVFLQKQLWEWIISE